MPALTESRLSHDFLELYRSYKRKTTKVFTWLKITCKLENTTITVLVDAAKTVRKQEIDVPTELYYIFKDAIALRVTVAQQFKQQVNASPGDKAKIKAVEAHDHFLERFKLIFKTLFPQPPVDALAKQLSKSLSLNETSPQPSKTNDNRFSYLPTIEDDYEPAINESTQTIAKAISDVSDEEEDLNIGDPLEYSMIFLDYASEMDALISDVKKLWERTAKDKCTVMYAALFTKLSIDTAFFLTHRAVGDLGLDDFQWLCDVHVDVLMNFDPQDLLDYECKIKYTQFSREGAFFEAVMKPAEDFLKKRKSGQLQHSDKMISPKAMIPWQTTRLPKKSMPDAVFKHPDPLAPMHWIFARHAEADRLNEKRYAAVAMMLEDMDRYKVEALKKVGKKNVRSLELMEIGFVDSNFYHLWIGLEELIACNGVDYTPNFNISVSFLYESYNSYVWGGTEVATTKNTRLQLLQHYKELAAAVSDLLRVTRQEKDWERFESMRPFADELKRLAATSRWDLYSQAPLLNGLAMLEISYQSMYQCINLWNDDGVVGQVLHAYNLVQKMNILKRDVPILERLCALLHEAVFMSNRPTHNFRPAMFRFLGGKMERAGKRRDHSDERELSAMFGAESGRSHYIDSPNHLPTPWADDRRIKPAELSKIYALHEEDFRLSAAIKGVPKTMFRKRGSKKRGTRPAGEHDFDEEDWTNHTGRGLLRYINADLRSEVNMTTDDAFPITRINGFAVYLMCRDILERIWNKAEKGLYSPQEIAKRMLLNGKEEMIHPRVAGKGSGVVAFTMDLVDGGGKTKTMMKGRNMYKMKAQEPTKCLKWITEAILEATEAREDPKEYLWKHL